jgi:hypothetical protein
LSIEVDGEEVGIKMYDEEPHPQASHEKYAFVKT